MKRESEANFGKFSFLTSILNIIGGPFRNEIKFDLVSQHPESMNLNNDEEDRADENLRRLVHSVSFLLYEFLLKVVTKNIYLLSMTINYMQAAGKLIFILLARL